MAKTVQKTPRAAPGHLTPSSVAWWDDVAGEYDLDEATASVLLVACEAKDQAARARAVLGRDGETVTDRFGQLTAHPSVLIEKNARADMQRAIRQLDVMLSRYVR